LLHPVVVEVTAWHVAAVLLLFAKSGRIVVVQILTEAALGDLFMATLCTPNSKTGARRASLAGCTSFAQTLAEMSLECRRLFSQQWLYRDSGAKQGRSCQVPTCTSMAHLKKSTIYFELYIYYMYLPDQTFDILLIGFNVKIRSKNLIRVRSVYWSNSDQKPPYSPTKYFSNFHIKFISVPDQFVWSGI
jgi:hypothetical protein